jgi:hypothetical protein
VVVAKARQFKRSPRMVSAVAVREGTQQINSVVLAAVVRQAHRQAELTAAVLKAWGLAEGKASPLPAGFLLELGAVLELGLWERQGVRPYLTADLPSYREAADELGARASKGPVEFEVPGSVRLWPQVLRVWLEQFAWDGPEALGADLLVGQVDEDALVDVLAEFLWQHRHEVAGLQQQGVRE